VRREILVAASVTAALFACSDASPQSAESLAPPPDHISGCEHGAALAKAVITLTRAKDQCHAVVLPGSVCVKPGGVIRWKIDNGCGAIAGTEAAPALEITVPTYTAPIGDLAAASGEDAERARRLDSCGIKIASLPDQPLRPVFCEVSLNAANGFYKYGLQGKIEPVDPDVEVRPGR
jgi:hypothetical protein